MHNEVYDAFFNKIVTHIQETDLTDVVDLQKADEQLNWYLWVNVSNVVTN